MVVAISQTELAQPMCFNSLCMLHLRCYLGMLIQNYIDESNKIISKDQNMENSNFPTNIPLDRELVNLEEIRHPQ